MNLVLCEPSEVDADGVVVLTGARAMHVRSVLGARPGTRCASASSMAPRDAARSSRSTTVESVLRCELDGAIPAPPAVDLLLALPRPKVLRRLWAQLAALGVGRIVLTNASRVERHYFDTHVLEESTYRPLLIEGLQQAGDTRLPRVSIHRQFRPLVERDLAPCPSGELRLVAHPARRPPAAHGRASAHPLRVLLAIGPEGGWNAFELELLERHGFEGISLGPRILRTDTACIALLALLHEALRRPIPS